MSATIKDIAKKTGLGLATISKYLNGGNVLPQNKQAIEQAITALDYKVNAFARSLKTAKSNTIGVIIPELSNIFVTTIITVIEDILRNNGYSIIVSDCRTDEALEKDVVTFMMEKRVDGIINMPVSSTGAHLQPALSQGLPVVLIDRKLKGTHTDVVMIDNAAAASQATLHLVEKGHQDIGIIVGPKDIFTSSQRLLGYEQALNTIGITPNAQHIVFSNYTVQGGYESMKKLLSLGKRPSAVFVTNYEMTLGAMIAVNEMGFSIPQDLSFIGFDNMQLSRVIQPKLTIVDQPLMQIGTEAANVMLARLTDETRQGFKTIRLKTELKIRESVAQI